jgi:oxygen-independent coproporphyrinogen-3 oxidase
VNLYVHFPFCRSKCAYCALHSYVGKTESDRQSYIDRISADIEKFFVSSKDKPLSTLYFGGGTPAMCDLSKLFDIINRQKKSENFEFTVELNPLDVTPQLLSSLKIGGVNRLSMGVQSLDDGVLQEMKRPHTAKQASTAWQMIRDSGFDNAGIDLICGWPNKTGAWKRTLELASGFCPDHCSVYTLILEPKTRLALDVEKGVVSLPTDDIALAELAEAEHSLKRLGLERYEISSFAKPGKECRHNLATWRGEDYTGIGDGACSREGNAVSRVIFRLRLLKEGFSPIVAARDFPELEPRVEEWTATLNQFVKEGLLTQHKNDGCPISYRLTDRGTEVCDTILAELV